MGELDSMKFQGTMSAGGKPVRREVCRSIPVTLPATTAPTWPYLKHTVHFPDPTKTLNICGTMSNAKARDWAYRTVLRDMVPRVPPFWCVCTHAHDASPLTTS